jgi:hypothetical protein
MPILSSIAGAAAKAYGLMSNALRLITDNFNRTNGSLGTTNTGQTWSATRGTWSISSNQATSSDSANNYPMATVEIGVQNVDVSADINGGGPGVAFWVTDANSWWASSANYSSSSYSCNCQTCQNPSTCNAPCNVSATGCPPCGTSTVNVGCGCYSGYFDNGIGCVDPESNQTYPYCTSTQCNSPCTVSASTCPPCSTSPGSTYPCNCSTCYNDSIDLKIYSSVSGSVSSPSSLTIWTGTSGSFTTTVGSILISTSSNTITAQAYSSAGLNSQVGSTLTYTPSSPTKGTKVGIIKTPSSANAGSTLDNFSAEG